VERWQIWRLDCACTPRRETVFLRIPKLLNEEQVAAMRRALDADTAQWVDGRVTAGHQGAAVKRNQQIEELSPLARELGNVIVAELERNALFVSAILPHRVYPPMFNRYGEGMHFGTHVDGAVRMIPGSSAKLRTDLSATVFLAAPEFYEGGELIIDSDFGSDTIKLAAGDMIVYSSGSRHRVNPVTRGMRLAGVFWIQSLIRDDLRRAQLFELDRTIQRLTELQSDPESLVRLAAHYHNLLRLWTEL
jgi:PKHD-type hydroxylase